MLNSQTKRACPIFYFFLNRFVLFSMILAVCLLPTLSQAQKTFYVDARDTSRTDTWSGAFSDLQEALLQAKAGDEIWVAAGVYYPTPGRDREASFHMPRRC